ncbi:MAG: ADP-ribosylglycohydrolase family protein, partial [Gammaproteobacteria bacterium]
MKNRWLWWNKWDLKSERQQLIDEGRNIGSLEAEFTRLAAEGLEENEQFQHDVNELFDKARALPIRSGYPYIEPSDLPSIKAHRAAGPRVIPLDVSEDVRRDRIAGAWMGRCAGCLLGKPVEGIKRPQLQRLMERAGCRDIPDYLWRLPGMTERDYRDVEFGYLWDFFRETDCFPGDDDTNYTVAGMAL